MPDFKTKTYRNALSRSDREKEKFRDMLWDVLDITKKKADKKNKERDEKDIDEAFKEGDYVGGLKTLNNYIEKLNAVVKEAILCKTCDLVHGDYVKLEPKGFFGKFKNLFKKKVTEENIKDKIMAYLNDKFVDKAEDYITKFNENPEIFKNIYYKMKKSVPIETSDVEQILQLEEKYTPPADLVNILNTKFKKNKKTEHHTDRVWEISMLGVLLVDKFFKAYTQHVPSEHQPIIKEFLSEVLAPKEDTSEVITPEEESKYEKRINGEKKMGEKLNKIAEENVPKKEKESNGPASQHPSGLKPPPK